MKDDRQIAKASAKFSYERQRLDVEYRKILPDMLARDAHRNKATPPNESLLTVQQLATAEAAGIAEWKARAKAFQETVSPALFAADEVGLLESNPLFLHFPSLFPFSFLQLR